MSCRTSGAIASVVATCSVGMAASIGIRCWTVSACQPHRRAVSVRVDAHGTHAAEGAEAQHLDVRREVAGRARARRGAGRCSGTSCCCRQNTVTTTASGPSSFCDLERAEEVGARGDADRQPMRAPASAPSGSRRRRGTATTASSSSSFTIGGMNSSEMPWMRCWPTLWPVESVGRVRRLERVDAHRGRCARAGSAPTPMTVPPVPTPATNASGLEPDLRELRPDLRPGRSAVRLDVGVVRELARQEDVGVARPQAPRPARCCRGSRLCAALTGTIAAPKLAISRHALAAHPVRHEDRHRMAERAADRRERDAGVAAGRLDDRSPGRMAPVAIGALRGCAAPSGP